MVAAAITSLSNQKGLRRYDFKMRFLLKIAILIAVAGVVDSFYFDGQYRQAVFEEVNYQGQQVRYQVDLLVSKVIHP